MTLADQWRTELLAWRLPDELLHAAPEDPYRFDASLLARQQQDPRTTSTGQRVMGLLPESDATLLDVGCGPGAVGAAFLDHADVTGVEPQPHLAAAARDAGLTVVEGTWPDVAAEVASADVVLCSHVLYNVAELAQFVAALDSHAHAGVVCALTATHPWTGLGRLYRHFHGLDRPTGPTARHAAAVIESTLDRSVDVEEWSRPAARYPDMATLVAHRRRQLCLTPAADPAVEAEVRKHVDVIEHSDGTVSTGSTDLATLWWSTAEQLRAL